MYVRVCSTPTRECTKVYMLYLCMFVTVRYRVVYYTIKIVLFIIEQIVNSVHVCTIVHVPVHVIKFSLGTFVLLCVM